MLISCACLFNFLSNRSIVFVCESGCRHCAEMGFTLVVIIALFTLANQMVVQAADLTCIIGPHHKSSPSPEPDIRADTACSRYSSLSCCAANTSHSIDQQGEQELYNRHWDECGVLTPECERFMKAETCFFSCDPYVGQWKTLDNSTFFDLPICSSSCDKWFDACKDVSVCAQNWITDYKEDNITGRFYCVNKTCRTIAQRYQNGKGMCETIWGDEFRYVADSDNCLLIDFTGDNPNANVKKDISGAHSFELWQSCLSSLLAFLSYILLQF